VKDEFPTCADRRNFHGTELHQMRRTTHSGTDRAAYTRDGLTTLEASRGYS